MSRMKARFPNVYTLTAVLHSGERVLVDTFTTKAAAQGAGESLKRAEAVLGQMSTVSRYEVTVRLAAGGDK